MAEPTKMTLLLRPSDVATMLCVSRTWVYTAAEQGRIPSIRLGGESGPLRFVAEDVERWLDEARKAWLPGRRSVPTRTQFEEAASEDQFE